MEEYKDFSLSLKLTGLSGAQVQQSSATGKVAVIIPIEQSDLFLTEKGDVYLNLTMRHINPDWADPQTHLDKWGKSHELSQSYSKARRESLPKGVYPPKIGSAKPFGIKYPAANDNRAEEKAYNEQHKAEINF